MERLYRAMCLACCLMATALTFSQSLNDVKKEDVVIYFDNDAHGKIDGYSHMAWLREQTLKTTPNVLLATLGDFSQGSIYCYQGYGEQIIDLMNQVGYDIMLPGNHEFDFGMQQLRRYSELFKGETVLCNFKNISIGRDFFPSYCIRRLGNHEVAFIGVISPITETNDSPQSYFDENGKRIYTFFVHSLSYRLQQVVNHVRANGADIVVVLAHLGDQSYRRASSEELLRATRGIDVMLDGHAHSIIARRMVTNVDGIPTALCSTGWMFQNIGRLLIKPDGTCLTSLIPVDEKLGRSEDIDKTLAQIKEKSSKQIVLGKTSVYLKAFEKKTQTYDRNFQSNLGDFFSDAIRLSTNSDIGWINAGGLRAGIPEGTITLDHLRTTLPYGDNITVAAFTGQQLLDALEYGVSFYPDDSGSFPQVSGLRYKFDPVIPSPVAQDELGVMTGIKNDKRRVYDVEVLDAQGNYVPLSPTARYRVASFDYLIRNGGCGGSMSGGEILSEDEPSDIQVFETYLQQLGEKVPMTYAEPQKRSIAQPRR